MTDAQDDDVLACALVSNDVRGVGVIRTGGLISVRSRASDGNCASSSNARSRPVTYPSAGPTPDDEARQKNAPEKEDPPAGLAGQA
jgi:hypothetical protein